MNRFLNLVSVVLCVVPSVIYAHLHFTGPNGGSVDIDINGLNNVIQTLMNSAIQRIQNPNTPVKQLNLGSIQTTIKITRNGHTEKHVVNSLWPNYNGQSSSSVPFQKIDEDDFDTAGNYGSSIDGNDNEISFERDDTALCTRCEDETSVCEIIDQPQDGGSSLLRTRNCKDDANTLSTLTKRVPNKDGLKQISKRMINID
ncbi:uncharacterized protein LOC123292079 [Chrysoperla carnea]|uniref:uncharacterized protein LOC123292079 n=1 Tax=Chrysoperla carnea TaxID=189513 RepID=UPI001D09185B|nr:uncharacterized protein LOC123292079 [Chrysoperla carnea]